jgi:hypothetical protein
MKFRAVEHNARYVVEETNKLEKSYYSRGDVIEIYDSGYNYLCMIAAVGKQMVRLVTISPDTGNRWSKQNSVRVKDTRAIPKTTVEGMITEGWKARDATLIISREREARTSE